MEKGSGETVEGVGGGAEGGGAVGAEAVLPVVGEHGEVGQVDEAVAGDVALGVRWRFVASGRRGW